MENKIIIRKETFAIVKAKKSLAGAFANIQDENEITLIIDKDKLNKEDIIEIEEDYKLLIFDMVIPFDVTGFIAKISTALAEEKIPLFVISGYSTDHILIKRKYFKKAKNKLKSIGFKIVE
jgi:uncharacterized protein